MFLGVLLSFFALFVFDSSSVSLPGGIVSQVTGALACGYQQQGSLVNISGSIQVCLPPVFCNPETCPPQLGNCVNGRCQYISPYKGLATYNLAAATYYCLLESGGCNGALGGSVLDMARNAAISVSLPLCGASGTGNCVGIAATSPMLMGNSQIAHINGSYVPLWGLGLTYASGLCYKLTGPNGQIVVALTDRCAGYCRCDGSRGTDQAPYHECGEQQCYDSPNLYPNVPCVGTLPQIGYTTCGGNGCPVAISKCDWCASNSHAHFDVDTNAFANLCGAAGSAGHCKISAVVPVPCNVGLSPPSPSGGGGGGAAPANAYNCNGISTDPMMPLIPGTSYCCNWGLAPDASGTCVAGGTTSNKGATTTKASSNSAATSTAPSGVTSATFFNCNGVSPDPMMPLIPGTSNCCNWGLVPNANGVCVSSVTTTKAATSTAPAPANSFNCNGLAPDPMMPLIPGTKYCCNWGLVPIGGACISSATTTKATAATTKAATSTTKAPTTTTKAATITVKTAAAPANSFNCNGVSPGPRMPLIPGTKYCCNSGLTPRSTGGCA